MTARGGRPDRGGTFSRALPPRALPVRGLHWYRRRTVRAGRASLPPRPRNGTAAAGRTYPVTSGAAGPARQGLGGPGWARLSLPLWPYPSLSLYPSLFLSSLSLSGLYSLWSLLSLPLPLSVSLPLSFFSLSLSGLYPLGLYASLYPSLSLWTTPLCLYPSLLL